MFKRLEKGRCVRVGVYSKSGSPFKGARMGSGRASYEKKMKWKGGGPHPFPEVPF